jgi:hypothetical protein
MLAYARRTRTPKRDQVIVLLSVKAGLRACEIAALEWPMVLDANGTVGDLIEIRTAIAKYQSGRRIPMHPQLKQALTGLLREQRSSEGPVVVSTRGGRMRANSIVNWFVAMFAELTLEGCSSHSGRRTFITAAARNVHRTGGSLRDVQVLAGHRSIETTRAIYRRGHSFAAPARRYALRRPVMTDIDQARTQEATARIRELNDQLRISHTGGTLVTTPGVLALGIYLNQAILIAIAAYDDFDEDNDPFGEHDFGLVEIAEQEVLFKIDYYDNDLRFHSPDPADPAVTRRVLTIFLPEEY